LYAARNGVFPLASAKIFWISLSQRLRIERVVLPMLPSEAGSSWWDRSVDESGRVLRTDVREAAHNIWRVVCVQAKRQLGDASDAAELLETVVEAVSRYLDKRNVPVYSADCSGLLVLAFYRSLRRLAKRRARIDSVGSTSEIADLLYAPDWSDQVDRHLFLEQLTCELSRKARGMLRLRLDGYGWAEIGRMLGMKASAARAVFWRAVRKAQFRLLGNIGNEKAGSQK
jgi:DNA-directed RNA polymerase specialized sigma24 family protein